MVQVLAPYPNIRSSVECLDTKRLKVQIYRECLVLALGGYSDHPVYLMWKYHTHFLCEYAFAGLRELQHRGVHQPNTFDKFHNILLECADTGPPSWWGNMAVHDSHKGVLLRKGSSFYSKYNWTVPPRKTFYCPKMDLIEELKKIQHHLKGEK